MGFTLEELAAAKISRRKDRPIGISVDHRRRNHSVESLQQNVARLKEYQNKLILFPLNAKKPRKGDASADDIAKATQLVGEVLPVSQDAKRPRAMELTDDFKTFNSIRQARAVAKLWGIRAKKAREAEADDL